MTVRKLLIFVLFIGPLLDAAPRITSSAASGPDLTVSLESTRPGWPRNEAKITVTVRNVGHMLAPRSDCRVIIRQGHAPRQVIRTIKKAVRALGAGDRYEFAFPVKVGLGLFEVAATVDRKNKIAEADETNNAARIMIVGE